MVEPKDKLICVAMVVCDDIFRDVQTGKAILVGAFSTIGCEEFPALHHQLSVYFTITNGNGEYDLSLSIEEEATGNNLVTLRGPLTTKDPLELADIDIHFRHVEFPSPGKYWITLKSDGEIINQRPILLKRLEEKEERTGGADAENV